MEQSYKRRPVNTMDAQQLMKELTEDAIMLRATPLPRFTEAITRIAMLWQTTPDAVYQQIVDFKKAATGNTQMPLA